MQLINPSEISSKIMTMIEDCESKLILVSPYVKISKWYKLKKKFEEAINKNISIEFYIRDDSENKQSMIEVNEFGIEPILVPNLHCKLYLNENYAIITSMNLLLSSEINSLEIGYITETKEEYNDVLKYYNKYLSIYKKGNSKKNENTKNIKHWLDLIVTEMDEKCKKLYIDTDESGITINTGINTYNMFLWNNNKSNILRINGILSGKQYDILSKQVDALEKEIGLKIITQNGTKGHYDLIWGESKKAYTVNSIHDAVDEEAKRISDEVKNFILTIDKKKKEIY